MNTSGHSGKAVLEELRNIVLNYPLFAGNTLSHATANECVDLGWAERNQSGDFLPTAAGLRIDALRPE